MCRLDSQHRDDPGGAGGLEVLVHRGHHLGVVGAPGQDVVERLQVVVVGVVADVVDPVGQLGAELLLHVGEGVGVGGVRRDAGARGVQQLGQVEPGGQLRLLVLEPRRDLGDRAVAEGRHRARRTAQDAVALGLDPAREVGELADGALEGGDVDADTAGHARFLPNRATHHARRGRPSSVGHNVGRGTTQRRGAGERLFSAPASAPRRSILALAVGMTVTLVAWGVLVGLAIEFGKEARSGEPEAWTFLALGRPRRHRLPVPGAAPRRPGPWPRCGAEPTPPARPVGGRRRKVD